MWAIVVYAIGANNIPKSFDQCWSWCESWLPARKQFHTLGIAAVCWAIWKTRNAVCFEGKTVNNPASIVCYACSLMGYWAGLFLENDKATLEAGVKAMLEIASKLVAREKKCRQLTLEETQDDDQD